MVLNFSSKASPPYFCFEYTLNLTKNESFFKTPMRINLNTSLKIKNIPLKIYSLEGSRELFLKPSFFYQKSSLEPIGELKLSTYKSLFFKTSYQTIINNILANKIKKVFSN